MRPIQLRISMWALFIASLLVSGWYAVCDNHAVQIPLVNWLNDPALYPHDPFMAVLTRYPSLLWPAVAFAARVFPLEGMLIGLFFLERLFVLYAAGRLARAFAPRSGLAVVAAMALFAFAVDSVLGRGTIVESYFEQTGLSIALLLMAAAAFEEFAGKAPEEVRADFQVLAASFSKYAEILKDVDLTSGQQPDAATVAKIQAIFTGEDATRSQEASQRINDWSNANCAP